MEHLSSAMEHQEQLQWRRDKVQELCSKGYSQREVSQTLQIGLATVNRDISYLRNQAKTNINRYIDEKLPEEYEKCLVGITSILKGLLTNATVVKDAMRFVSESEKSKGKDREQVKSSSCPSPSDSSNEDDKESKEPDYNDEKPDKVGSEEKQEQEKEEITINQVF